MGVTLPPNHIRTSSPIRRWPMVAEFGPPMVSGVIAEADDGEDGAEQEPGEAEREHAEDEHGDAGDDPQQADDHGVHEKGDEALADARRRTAAAAPPDRRLGQVGEMRRNAAEGFSARTSSFALRRRVGVDGCKHGGFGTASSKRELRINCITSHRLPHALPSVGRQVKDVLPRREGQLRGAIHVQTIVSVACALLLARRAPAWRARLRRNDEVIFEDKFTDDAGGWAINNAVEVKDGSFAFKLAARRHAVQPQRHLHRQGRRYLLRGASGPRAIRSRSAPGFCSGARTTRTISSSASSTAANIWIARKHGRQMAHHRREHRHRAPSRLSPARPTRSASRRAATPRPSLSTAPRCEIFAVSRRSPAGASGCPATISTRTKTRAWSSRSVKVTN